MARNKNRSFAKRKKEQLRQEKAAAKRAKRRDRPSSPGETGITHMEDGLTKARPSEDEVQAAIERAMNPGQVRAQMKRSAVGSGRLFVGNLDYGTEENELRQLFTEAGFEVTEASVMRDRMTGEPRGFGFVELAGADQAERAIQKLHGTDLHGRELRVNAAERGR